MAAGSTEDGGPRPVDEGHEGCTSPGEGDTHHGHDGDNENDLDPGFQEALHPTEDQ